MLALLGVLFVVPLFVGGRHPWGQVVLLGSATVGIVAAGISRFVKNPPAVHLSGAEWIIAAGVGLILLQIMPMPEPTLRWLSPAISRILPLWTAHGPLPELGPWRQISLSPAESWQCLWLFVAYVCLFYLVLWTIKSKPDVIRVLGLVGLAGVCAAVVAFLQYIAGTDKFLGIYEHPFRKASEYLTGSFSTKNHFGHFLSLSVGPLLFFVGWSRRESVHLLRLARGSEKVVAAFGRVTATLALTLVLAAVVLSLSRGAILSTAMALAFFLGVAVWRGIWRWRVAAGLLLACTLAGTIAFLGDGAELYERLRPLTSGDLETLDHRAARRLIWSTTLTALPDFAPFGAGAGSFRETYPVYLTRHDFPRYFTHAENGYLQVAFENGFPGLLLLLMAAGYGLSWMLRGLAQQEDRDLALAAGAAGASLVSSIVHSFVDFVWYVPACMGMTVVLLGIACRIAQLVKTAAGAEKQVPRWLLGSGILATAVLGVAGLGSLACLAQANIYWEQYLLSVRKSAPPGDGSGDQALEPASFAQPVDAEAPDLGIAPADSTRGPASEECDEPSAETNSEGVRGTVGGGHAGERPAGLAIINAADKAPEKQEERSRQIRRLIAILKSAVGWFPYHARAHLELARRYVELFEAEQARSEAPLSLVHIRDAARQAAFSTPEARRRWLATVLGDRREYLDRAREHALTALKLCPLLAEGYLLLADLAFVVDQDEAVEKQLVQQALQARPKDGTILFVVGQRAMAVGDLESGLRFWQEAFQCGTVYQERIIRWLAGRISPADIAAEIEFFLHFFRPPLSVLQVLHDYYQSRGAEEALSRLREQIAARAVAEAKAASNLAAVDNWLLAARMYQKLGRHGERLAAAKEAFRLAPANYRVRYFLAEAYLAIGDLREAEKHFQWCLFRQPTNESLRRKLEQVHSRLVNGGALPAGSDRGA